MRSCIGWDPLGTVGKRMAIQMARDNREREPAAFRPEDEIDEVFARANPNPARTGCPGKDVLRSAARKALPIDHPVFEHLAGCSACYQEFRQLQQSVRVPSRVRPALAAAAVVLIAVGGVTYFGRNRVIGLPGDTQTNATTQPLLIDYRGEGTTRSEAGDPARKSVTVPRASLEATILLPIGSEPGQYQLRLLDGDKRSKLAKEASGDSERFGCASERQPRPTLLAERSVHPGDSSPGRGLGPASADYSITSSEGLGPRLTAVPAICGLTMGSGASNSSISIDAKPTLSSAVRVSLSGWQPSPIRRQSGFTRRCILCSQLPRLAATCSMNKNLPPGLRTLATSSKSSLLVHHATEHQGADHEIYALVRGWQRFGDPVA